MPGLVWPVVGRGMADRYASPADAGHLAYGSRVTVRGRLWPRIALRKAAVCAAVHAPATGGRIPVSSQAAIRSEVHTAARGRRAGAAACDVRRRVDCHVSRADGCVQRRPKRSPFHPRQRRCGDRMPCRSVLPGESGETSPAPARRSARPAAAGPGTAPGVQADVAGVATAGGLARPAELAQPTLQPLADGDRRGVPAARLQHDQLAQGPPGPHPCPDIRHGVPGGACRQLPARQLQRQVPAAVAAPAAAAADTGCPSDTRSPDPGSRTTRTRSPEALSHPIALPSRADASGGSSCFAGSAKPTRLRQKRTGHCRLWAPA